MLSLTVSCKIPPDGSDIFKGFPSFWLKFYNGTFKKIYLEANINKQYLWLRNNTAQLFFILVLGRANLHWNFCSIPKDGSDVHRFSNSKWFLTTTKQHSVLNSSTEKVMAVLGSRQNFFSDFLVIILWSVFISPYRKKMNTLRTRLLSIRLH